MAQLVKYLLYKHKDLSSNPLYLFFKKLSVVIYVSIKEVPKFEASLYYMANFKLAWDFLEDPISKNQGLRIKLSGRMLAQWAQGSGSIPKYPSPSRSSNSSNQ